MMIAQAFCLHTFWIQDTFIDNTFKATLKHGWLKLKESGDAFWLVFILWGAERSCGMLLLMFFVVVVKNGYFMHLAAASFHRLIHHFHWDLEQKELRNDSMAKAAGLSPPFRTLCFNQNLSWSWKCRKPAVPQKYIGWNMELLALMLKQAPQHSEGVFCQKKALK